MKRYSVDDVMPASKAGLLPVTVAVCLAFTPSVFADEVKESAEAEVQKTETAVVGAPAPAKEGAAAPAKEEAAAPAKEEAAAPAKEEVAAPAKEEVAAPAKEEAAAPAKEEAAAPAKEEAVAPAKEEAAAPAKKEAVAPAKEEAAAPAKEQTAAPAKEEAVAPAKDVLNLEQRQNRIDRAKSAFLVSMKIAQEAYGKAEYENARKTLIKAKKDVEDASTSTGADKLLSDIQAKAYLEEIADLKQKCDRDEAELIYNTNRDIYLNAASSKDDLKKAGEDCDKVILNLKAAKNLYYIGSRLADADEVKKAVSRSMDSSFADKVDVLIEQAEKISDYADLVLSSSMEAIDPAYLDNQRLIAQYYRESEQFFRKQRYDQARASLEKILTIDPYNEKATELLNKVYKKLYTIGDMRRYNDLLMDQALTEWRWAEKFPNQDAEERITPQKEEYSDITAIYDKAGKLMIPSINFSNVPVVDAINALRELSKQYDNPDHVGLNIVANGVDDKKTVTFSLQDVSLLQALHYLTMFAGLKYYIDEKQQNILIASPEEIAKRKKKDRITLRVLQSTVTRMIESNKARKGDAGDEDGKDKSSDFSADSKISAGRSKPKDKVDYRKELMTYFRALGFPFDPNEKSSESFITYNPSSNEMTVQATPDVLRQLTDVIRRLDISAPLVMIEAKIMEIAVEDLEELGFNWTLEHTADNLLPNWNFKIASPYKSYIPESETSEKTIDTAVINNLNLLPNFGSDSSWNLFLTVNALDRQTRTEMLSTPKVTTVNAQQATIRMVRQEYFPNSEWTEPEVETEDNSISMTPSIPEFDEEPDNLGIEFTVTPNADATTSMISLDGLKPSVKELTGWTDYSYDIIYNGDSETNPIKMPEITVRDVVTNVKVYDGQNVVIGGMLVDKQEKNDGRWPVLGDLPLVGRLFGNRSTIIRKDNLIISVTARLVNQFGLPINSNNQNGLPEYGR